jgi:hypothetical protein
MKTVQLSQPNFTTPANGAAADNISIVSTVQNPFANQKDSVTTTATTQQPHIFKTLVDVVGEGLKQNFLGPNIDMEFLTLTVRSFASTSAKAIQHFVKPLNKKHPVETPCRQLNQPCF